MEGDNSDKPCDSYNIRWQVKQGGSCDRLQHQVQPMDSDGHVTDSSTMQQWKPPHIEHFVEPSTGPR